MNGKGATAAPSQEENAVGPEGTEMAEETEDEQVEMWSRDAAAGPEWGGPRGYEPTR